MGTAFDKEKGPCMGLKDFFYYKDEHILKDIKNNAKVN
jgi:hypothetical protein